jgi:Flp pilus assembly protein TadG
VSRGAFWRDARGGSMVEFAITLPLFGALLFGAVESGLMLWTQLGLQHGVEQAARCATVNTIACGSESAVQAYAVSAAYGLSVPPETFALASTTCGNEVTASYAYQFLSGRLVFASGSSVALTARWCFPK